MTDRRCGRRCFRSRRPTARRQRLRNRQQGSDPRGRPSPPRRGTGDRGGSACVPPVTLYAVSDELVVVTVTFSPGPHLDRFLASLSHATERTVSVVMADNGSIDGAPEEALERHPGARLLRT